MGTAGSRALPGSTQMANFVKVATQSDLPPINQAKEFRCGDKEICVANVDGSYSAIDNICLHRGGPLGQGAIERGKVVCPRSEERRVGKE